MRRSTSTLASRPIDTGAARARPAMFAAIARRLASALCVFAVVTASAAPLEYQVKASYLYNFVQFITWPSDASASPSASEGKFNLCVVGAERFGNALDALVGERIDGREIALRRLERPAQARAARCHLLFIAAGTPEVNSGEAVSERGLLTIGETPGFLQRGGIINLVEHNGRIRFEINQQAARTAGLVISSRILSLALNKP